MDDRSGATRTDSLGARVRRAWSRVADPRYLVEIGGERVVYRALERDGDLERYRGGRFLEIGPKHGEDSVHLAALGPSELVLLDLPEKRETVGAWLEGVQAAAPTRHVEANLLYASREKLDSLGTFDLVWCLGVVYHNVEQLRLLRRLFTLCRTGGLLVLESSTTRNRRLSGLNAVEIHWPTPYRGVPTITHHPSRLALKSWLEMVGFADVRIRDVYSRAIRDQRAVLTAVRPPDSSPYVSYASDDEPRWIAGEAT